MHFDIVLYCTGKRYLIPLDSSLVTTVLEMLKLENFPASSWGLTSAGGGRAGESSLAKSSSSDKDDGVDEGKR